MGNRHPTKDILIHGELCEIDVNIIEFIEFLNTIPGIKTEFSCQGDEPDDYSKIGYHYPYVMFTCKDKKIITKIKKAAKKASNETMQNIYFSQSIHMLTDPLKVSTHLHFDKIESLNLFYHHLKAVIV